MVSDSNNRRIQVYRYSSTARRDRKYYEDVAAGIAPLKLPWASPSLLFLNGRTCVPPNSVTMSTLAHKLNSRYQGQAYGSHGGPAYGAGYDWSQAYAAPSFAASAGPSGPRNPPSLTLHVAYLSPDTTDQELRSVFSQCPGFKTLRVTSIRGSLVAFVELIDMPNASMRSSCGRDVSCA